MSKKEEDKKCEPMDHPNLIAGGWSCCQCSPRTYNGGHRTKCKICAHKRCFYPEMIILSSDEVEDVKLELPDQLQPETDPKKLN